MASKDNAAPAAVSARVPAYVRLKDRFRHYQAGRVLAGTEDLIAALDMAKVAYEEVDEKIAALGGCKS